MASILAHLFCPTVLKENKDLGQLVGAQQNEINRLMNVITTRYHESERLLNDKAILTQEKEELIVANEALREHLMKHMKTHKRPGMAITTIIRQAIRKHRDQSVNQG